jgi:hypothetical protein
MPNLTPSHLLTLDVSGNITSDTNSYVTAPSLSSTLTSYIPYMASTLGTGVLQSPSSGNITSSNTLPSGCSATNTILTTPTFSGTVATGLTASKVLQTDGSGNLSASGVSSTTLGYLDATSSVQTQINGKQATLTGATTTVVSSNLTPSVVVVSDGSGKIASSAVTSTTLGYLDPTSSIQTQINGKQASVSVGNNVIVQTNGSGVLTGSTTLPSGSSATSMTLTTPTFSGNVTTGLAASELLQTNSSGVMIASNTLPSGSSATNMTLTTPSFSSATITGSNVYNGTSTQPFLFYDTSTGYKMGAINSFAYNSNNCFSLGSYTSTGTLIGQQIILGRDNGGYVLVTSPVINGAITWATDNDWDLGSATSRPANIRVANTGYFYGLSNGIAQISSSALTSSNTLPSGCSATSMTLTTPTFSGASTTQALLPSANNTYSIGSTGTRYANGYFFTGLDVTNNSGSGNWASISVGGSYNGNVINVLQLKNNTTTASSGTEMSFQGVNSGGTATTGSAYYSGNAFVIVANSVGVSLTNGASSWASACSKGLKNVVDSSVDHEKNIEHLDSIAIDRWAYKADETATENMGPYAEDILEKFNLGSGKELTTLQMDGVLFSCLKGMYTKHKKLEDLVNQLQTKLNDILEKGS